MKISTVLRLCSLFALLLASCGDYHNNPGEDYGDITSGEAGLTLVQSEHQIGWGKADCFECHNVGNIHQVNRTDLGVDMETVRHTVDLRGLAGCTACHGSNGT